MGKSRFGIQAAEEPMTNHRIRRALALAALCTAGWAGSFLAAEDLEKSVTEARRNFDLTADTDRGSVPLSKDQDALRRYVQSEWGGNWDPKWEREAGKGVIQPKAAAFDDCWEKYRLRPGEGNRAARPCNDPGPVPPGIRSPDFQEPPPPPKSFGPDKRKPGEKVREGWEGVKDAAQGFLGIAKYLAPPAIGAAGGGVIGALIAGAPGAVVGATIGSVGGAVVTVGMIVSEIAKGFMDAF